MGDNTKPYFDEIIDCWKVNGMFSEKCQPIIDKLDAAQAQQIILLKLDDVTGQRVGTKPVPERWQKVHDYLIAQGIKGSFGVITESLEKDNAMYFQWLKDVQAAGRIELWMHGYKMRGPKDTGEFESGTAAEQKAILAKLS